MTDLMRIDPHYAHGLLVGLAIGVLLGAVAVAFIVAWWCAQLEREKAPDFPQDDSRVARPTLPNLAFRRRSPDPVVHPVVLAFRRPLSVHPPEDN